MDDSRAASTHTWARSSSRSKALVVAALFVVLLIGGLLSCSSVRYVSQSLAGGAKVLLDRQPIEQVLKRNDLEPEVRRKLELVLSARAFASERLLLPVGKSYGAYVEVGRPYVAWNVVAAPSDSVQPKTWCFPIAGCVSYRGYFKERRAQRYADRLRAEGWDVAVGGVTAYSTLGWFADPVLDTFLQLEDSSLVGLLFHELAHRKLYVPGDTAFNESFASYVALVGERLWQQERSDGGETAEAAIEQAALLRDREATFLELVLATQQCLDSLYGSEVTPGAKEKGKAAELSDLRQRYAAVRAEWVAEAPNGPVYDAWFDQELNNAHVAAIGDYSIWLDSFAVIERSNADLESFYRRAEELAEQDFESRQLALQALAPAELVAAELVVERSCASAIND